MLRMGADEFEKVNCTGDDGIATPGKVGEMPETPRLPPGVTMAPRPQGESEFSCRSAPLTKLPAVMLGACGRTVRLKVRAPRPVVEATEARMLAGPVTAP